MLLKDLCLPKAKITTVSDTITLQQALDTLEESGYRCIPVLADNGKKFCGNIYKMHIYRHIAQGGDTSLPVTTLIKNVTKHICIETSFYNVFFTIKELPYIAVLDKNDDFYGILPHSTMLGLLQESWNIDSGSYVLTVGLPEIKGSLHKLTKIVNKYTSISSIMSLDSKSKNFVRRVLITLPIEVDEKLKNTIVDALEENGHRVVSVEKLNN